MCAGWNCSRVARQITREHNALGYRKRKTCVPAPLPQPTFVSGNRESLRPTLFTKTFRKRAGRLRKNVGQLPAPKRRLRFVARTPCTLQLQFHKSSEHVSFAAIIAAIRNVCQKLCACVCGDAFLRKYFMVSVRYKPSCHIWHSCFGTAICRKQVVCVLRRDCGDVRMTPFWIGTD